MEFWLVYKNERLRLPVAPPSFQLGTGNSNITVTSLNIGEINLPGKGSLSTISISSFFPTEYHTYCDYKNIPKPYTCVDLIEKWKKNNYVVRLTITGTNISINTLIEKFDYGVADRTNDVAFQLDLKEYRFLDGGNTNSYYNPVKTKYSASSRGTYKRPTSKPDKKPNYYVIQKGDTLAMIAKKVYGDSSKWKVIAAKNKIKNPDKITLGQRLVL